MDEDRVSEAREGRGGQREMREGERERGAGRKKRRQEGGETENVFMEKGSKSEKWGGNEEGTTPKSMGVLDSRYCVWKSLKWRGGFQAYFRKSRKVLPKKMCLRGWASLQASAPYRPPAGWAGYERLGWAGE
jgi:hypothetical protein